MLLSGCAVTDDFLLVHCAHVGLLGLRQRSAITSTSSWLAVWLSGKRVGFDQRSCATSDPVSTRMGDRLWTGKPSRFVTSQLGRLSLLPSVGR